MIVVDASVALKWVHLEPGSDAARAVLDRGDNLAAPDLWVLEVGNAISRRHRSHETSTEEAARQFAALTAGRVELTATRGLVQEAFRLALALGHPIYDCAYLALALRLSARLVTADVKFAKAAQNGGYGHLIELIGPDQA